MDTHQLLLGFTIGVGSVMVGSIIGTILAILYINKFK